VRALECSELEAHRFRKTDERLAMLLASAFHEKLRWHVRVLTYSSARGKGGERETKI
jgi:hypothetical protein